MNILVNQITVIHIAAVAFNAELFLDDVVELVRQHERGVLRDLTPKPVPYRAEVLEKVVCKLAGARIVDTARKLILDRPMLRRAEVVLEVKDENPALESMLSPMTLQMAVEAVHCEVDPFALDACGVIIDERRLENLRDYAVAEVSLYSTFGDMDAANVSPLAAVIELKLIEASAFVGARH